MRMFIALPLPEAVKEDLSTFLEPRQEAAPDLRWALPEQWHLTLAFLPEVADRHTDELLERLERAASRRKPLDLRLIGAGAFPHAGHAKVLWGGVEHDGEELMRLAGGGRGGRGGGGEGGGGGRGAARREQERHRGGRGTVSPSPDFGPADGPCGRHRLVARAGPVFRSLLAVA